MGKRDYAESLYKEKNFDFIYDLEKIQPEEINLKNKNKNFALILNLHLGVKNLLSRKIDPVKFFEDRIEFFRNSILIGDEISGGVIPLDKSERLWRGETGRLYKFLATEADIVDRVFAGLSLRLKGF